MLAALRFGSPCSPSLGAGSGRDGLGSLPEASQEALGRPVGRLKALRAWKWSSVWSEGLQGALSSIDDLIAAERSGAAAAGGLTGEHPELLTRQTALLGLLDRVDDVSAGLLLSRLHSREATAARVPADLRGRSLLSHVEAPCDEQGWSLPVLRRIDEHVGLVRLGGRRKRIAARGRALFSRVSAPRTSDFVLS